MDYTHLARHQDISQTGLIFEIGSLSAYFQRVKDNRKPKGKRYPMVVLLLLMLLAKLSGENTPSGRADWVAHRNEALSEMKILPRKQTPSHMNYRRVRQDTLQPEEAPPEKLLALTRQYWGIENSLHYRRDVTLKEDATRLTVGNTGHNMAVLKNLVVSLCLQAGLDNLAKAHRLFNVKSDLTLKLITSAGNPFL